METSPVRNLKVTKFVHSCLLIETTDHVALFDPGMMSEGALDVGQLERLDDIFITHEHSDHISPSLMKQLVARFPSVRITSTVPVMEQLAQDGITAGTEPPETATLFTSPHEDVRPWREPPEEIGVHYMGILSHPGDSHSFTETMPVLALPVNAPWGSAINAMKLGLKLKPKFVLPIHDWHWRDEARQSMYDGFVEVFGPAGITFCKLETGQPVELAL